jgi:hypothetical protein
MVMPLVLVLCSCPAVTGNAADYCSDLAKKGKVIVYTGTIAKATTSLWQRAIALVAGTTPPAKPLQSAVLEQE